MCIVMLATVLMFHLCVMSAMELGVPQSVRNVPMKRVIVQVRFQPWTAPNKKKTNNQQPFENRTNLHVPAIHNQN